MSLSPDMSTPISKAIEGVTKLDSHVYKVHLGDEFCLGKVPNGGYVASCMLAAAKMHLSPRGQPDTLTAHFEYPNRASTGPAIVAIDEVKLGQQLSTLHLTLWQGALLSQAPWIDRSASRRIVLAYTTHTDLQTFAGISLPTGYEGRPDAALPDLPDFYALKGTSGTDGIWEEPKIPSSAVKFVRSLQNWHFYLPRLEPLVPGVLDMWIRLASGENITQGMIPYIADSFPYNMHTFLAAPELRQLLLAKPSETDDSRKGQQKELQERNEERASLWFPTLVMNLEVKSPLLKEGTEWLAVRITSKLIKDGRFDLDILIRDTEGEIIALSHHVAMILSVERNVGKDDSSTKASL
ncbi:thioesterase family protein [Pestalotiopsis sp. NC0098]|nr:thioesterase family protein [Pestalotiopsis sp. NC0098]